LRIRVVAVLLEGGETVGHIWGLTDDGTKLVHAAGDWRQVLVIGDAVNIVGPVPVDVDGWQILEIYEAPKDALG
jgi:hypothetical protein